MVKKFATTVLLVNYKYILLVSAKHYMKTHLKALILFLAQSDLFSNVFLYRRLKHIPIYDFNQGLNPY